jgi:hypothetical protein
MKAISPKRTNPQPEIDLGERSNSYNHGGMILTTNTRTWGDASALIRKRAKPAIIASQRARRIARLAQILRNAKSALLRMTIRL